MKPRQVVAAADPRPGGDGNLVLVVGDLHLFRTRVELQGDIKAMFDAERVRLGLPVTVN